MPKKIVVVDDEPDILRVVAFRLKKMGYHVLSAATGDEALTLISAERPGLILLDYCLPDMSGLDVARRIREDEAFRHTPIILLTAATGSEIFKKINASAVNDCLKKPFDSEELLACIKKYEKM